jgi:hypothetical protein
VIYKGIQWFFAPQAVVVDGAGAISARRISDTRLDGHLIRAAAMVCAVGAVSGLPGPLIGTVGLIAGAFSLNQAQWVSAAIYCVLYPISLIMATLFYLRVSTPPGKPAPYELPAANLETPPAAAPGFAPS